MCSDFMFVPEEYERVRREWDDLRARVAEVRDNFDNLDAIAASPPADDPATNEFLNRARIAVVAARESNGALGTYAVAFLANLDETAAAYTNTDDVSAEVITGSSTVDS